MDTATLKLRGMSCAACANSIEQAIQTVPGVAIATRKVWVGAIISGVLVIGSLPMMTGLNLPFIPAWLHNFWFQAILTAPVQFWWGRSFYINGWKAFKRRTATMGIRWLHWERVRLIFTRCLSPLIQAFSRRRG